MLLLILILVEIDVFNFFYQLKLNVGKDCLNNALLFLIVEVCLETNQLVDVKHALMLDAIGVEEIQNVWRRLKMEIHFV
jgi:hypothetical protein